MDDFRVVESGVESPKAPSSDEFASKLTDQLLAVFERHPGFLLAIPKNKYHPSTTRSAVEGELVKRGLGDKYHVSAHNVKANGRGEMTMQLTPGPVASWIRERANGHRHKTTTVEPKPDATILLQQILDELKALRKAWA